MVDCCAQVGCSHCGPDALTESLCRHVGLELDSRSYLCKYKVAGQVGTQVCTGQGAQVLSRRARSTRLWKIGTTANEITTASNIDQARRHAKTVLGCDVKSLILKVAQAELSRLPIFRGYMHHLVK